MLRSDMLWVDATFDAYFAAKRYLEKLRPSIKLLEHALVIRRGEVRHGDLQRRSLSDLDSHALALDLAPDPINAPRALLNRRGVPAQVMVNDVPTLTVEVDPFLADRGRDEDLRAVRGLNPRK